MLSTQNPAEANDFIYKNIKALLEGRYAILLEHLSMLLNVDPNQHNEDFNEYLEDVVGVSRKLNQIERIAVIKDLKENIDKTSKLIRQLIKFCMEPCSDTTMMQFMAALYYLREDAHFYHKQKISKHTPWDYKARVTFNPYTLIKECIKHLQPYLPKYYKTLEDIIELSHVNNVNISRNKKSVNFTNQVNAQFRSDKLTALYKNSYNVIEKYAYETTPNKIRSANLALVHALEIEYVKEAHECLIEALEDKNRLIMEIINHTNRISDHSNSTPDLTAKFFYDNSEYFIRMIYIFENIKEIASTLFKPSDKEKTTKKHYAVKQHNSNPAKTNENGLTNLPQAGKTAVAPEGPPSLVSHHPIDTTLSNEFKLFKENKNLALAEYKAHIAANRAVKAAVKISHAPISTSSNSIPPQMDNVKESYINDILLKLNFSQLEMLRDILNQNKEAKITYFDVYHLIKNHLEGTIEEIGNGSSHKRIRIGTFYTEIESTRDTIKAREITGGFYRPHTSGHNKETLSAFNLNLVAKTLIKSGISISLIDELEKRLETTMLSI